ncbi:UBA/TS-N domain containing protein [Histomonas meleagridis]|uniref:UBA/TS-N domain containing protein n=1 Tax=Histomonas meleagridis TaxID=135588 RepID=UPI003559CA95|nr:UBA/TS-N domain containing protein [Histomonas meleagridis]KAH0796628.1 UBA/TS-N domain containing protein [Histomonas meleagridis]KAH0796631.1 UBA/TS-N domain containing protein [Histomonas meleagridis]
MEEEELYEDYYQEGNYDQAYYEEEFYEDGFQEDAEMDAGNSIEFDFQADDVDPRETTLLGMVQTFKAIIYESEAVLGPNNTIQFDLKRFILPLSLQCVYGFLSSEILITIELELNNFRWDFAPKSVHIHHPVYGEVFPGKALMQNVVKDFFSIDYKPREYYQCSKFTLCSSTHPNKALVEKLCAEEHLSDSQSRRALSLCNNNYERALHLMRTGELLPGASDEAKPSDFAAYHQNPLLYFALELAETLFDLQDHCCLCRRPISKGLKPSVCDNKLCNFQFSTIGIGLSVIQEIKRDVSSADLLISLFSAAYDTKFCTPYPNDFTRDEIKEILHYLPTCDDMSNYENDQQLAKAISKRGLQLVRWILLSCRSHLIRLPPEMEIPMFKGSAQFMALVSSSEAESAFQSIKQQFGGSIYLFHGSHAERWHSIIRNGLVNASGTSLQANGSCYGKGIYFAKDSNTSWGYSQMKENNYRSSKLGKNLKVISLCEIANLPIGKEVTAKYEVRNKDGTMQQKSVKGRMDSHSNEWAYTLTIEEACVVRFVMVGGSFSVDVKKNPPKNVPSLRSVLDYQMNQSIN